jgi:hypothetical protein
LGLLLVHAQLAVRQVDKVSYMFGVAAPGHQLQPDGYGVCRLSVETVADGNAAGMEARRPVAPAGGASVVAG